jgi:general secretion pathway protein D
VSEVRKLLETKVAGGKIGAVGAVDETNHLLVTDTAENVRRIEKIVGEIDRPGLAQLTEVLPLSFVSADDIAHELNAAIAEEETRGDALRRRLPVTTETSQTAPRRAMVVPSPHANSLILVGTAEKILALKRLIAAVDVDAPGTRGRLNAIFLKYIAAEEAAKSLNALLKPADKATEGQARRHAIAIEASLANNALLVDAAPSDFEVVKKLVDQLDQPVDQVHIEVVIAEMTEGESLDIGVEMAALDMPSAVGDNVVQGGTRLNDGSSGLMTALQENLFPRGLSLGVARGTRVDSSGKMVLGYPTAINIDALKKDSRLKIRSNPSLMAQNNKEASVNIVNQIPILKSTIQGGTGTTRDVIQNIDRVDVGIKLKLTPTIIPGGQIRMVLNPSIEAVIDQGPSGTQFAPTIARREVSTTVTVRDTETIVIAGLTREDQTKRVRKIPLLGSIPLLGWLFRRTEDATEKSNVLIFVTPLIVSDAGTSARVTERLEKKTGLKTDEAK